MDTFIASLRTMYPHLKFEVGDMHRWEADESVITYKDDASQQSLWGVLHEMGHALLQHHEYTSDIDLLQKEVAAWEKAKQIAPAHHISIESEYIENCLDTYRNWLYKRSSCPACKLTGIQRTDLSYYCLNCHTTWQVTAERHHRSYRKINSASY